MWGGEEEEEEGREEEEEEEEEREEEEGEGEREGGESGQDQKRQSCSPESTLPTPPPRSKPKHHKADKRNKHSVVTCSK